MARRKPALIHGVIAIDKPAGMTSRAVVTMVSRLLGERRCGHAGTLDPDATGVLVVAFGEATKIVRWLMAARKTYRAQVRFGAATSTDDAAGELVRTEPIPDLSDLGILDAAATREMGHIMQVPPAVSALKRDGIRDHERVRRGERVQRDAREVRLDSVTRVAVDGADATFDVTCGAGFYVRAWARDLGEHLGSVAHLVALRRTHAGGFDVQTCLGLDALRDMEARERRHQLLPISAALEHLLPALTVTDEQEAVLRQGQRYPAPRHLTIGAEVWVRTAAHVPICMATVEHIEGAETPNLRVIRGFQQGVLCDDPAGEFA